MVSYFMVEEKNPLGLTPTFGGVGLYSLGRFGDARILMVSIDDG